MREKVFLCIRMMEATVGEREARMRVREMVCCKTLKVELGRKNSARRAHQDIQAHKLQFLEIFTETSTTTHNTQKVPAAVFPFLFLFLYYTICISNVNCILQMQEDAFPLRSLSNYSDIDSSIVYIAQ